MGCASSHEEHNTASAPLASASTPSQRLACGNIDGSSAQLPLPPRLETNTPVVASPDDTPRATAPTTPSLTPTTQTTPSASAFSPVLTTITPPARRSPDARHADTSACTAASSAQRGTLGRAFHAAIASAAISERDAATARASPPTRIATPAESSKTHAALLQALAEHVARRDARRLAALQRRVERHPDRFPGISRKDGKPVVSPFDLLVSDDDEASEHSGNLVTPSSEVLQKSGSAYLVTARATPSAGSLTPNCSLSPNQPSPLRSPRISFPEFDEPLPHQVSSSTPHMRSATSSGQLRLTWSLAASTPQDSGRALPLPAAALPSTRVRRRRGQSPSGVQPSPMATLREKLVCGQGVDRQPSASGTALGFPNSPP